MNPHIFREYDVRGLVERDLDPGVVERLGRAYGSHIHQQGGSRVAVGMDVRESSPELAAALIRGITAAGVAVDRLGMVPTPALYYAVHAGKLDGGVEVTGSHNPLGYNGFKMMQGRRPLFGEDIQSLRERIEQDRFATGTAEVREVNVNGAYLDALASGISLARPLKVVLDAGNGCAGPAAVELFRRLGCKIEALYCEPDGRFPNHMPDPTLPDTLVDLRERVLATGANLGLAYDGDADRLGAMDGTGRIVWGDQLLALFARRVLAERPGAPILFEVKCSQALIEDIEAHGGRPVMTRTGHSIIKQQMKETGSPLAGEMSGHLFFADRWFGFDDAIYASARLAELVAAASGSLAELVDGLPRYHASPEIRVDCADDAKFEVVEKIKARYRPSHAVVEVDGARISFKDGWGLVRASNTQPVLVVRAEGRTPEDRDRILAELGEALAALGVREPLA